jgi:hypothetical protein
MPTAPSQSANWADNGTTAVVVDPGATKQALGWVGTEKPSEGHMNWILYVHGKWIQYLGDVWSYIQNPTTTLTYSGRRLTRADWPTGRLVFNYAATGARISSIVLQPAGGGSAIYTWTPTFTGRVVTTWTRT